jgi:hypothetical protein
MQTSVATKKSYIVTISLSQEEADLLLNVYREINNRLVLSPDETLLVKAILSAFPKPKERL